MIKSVVKSIKECCSTNLDRESIYRFLLSNDLSLDFDYSCIYKFLSKPQSIWFIYQYLCFKKDPKSWDLSSLINIKTIDINTLNLTLSSLYAENISTERIPTDYREKIRDLIFKATYGTTHPESLLTPYVPDKNISVSGEMIKLIDTYLSSWLIDYIYIIIDMIDK